jgi:hypothetical protein
MDNFLVWPEDRRFRVMARCEHCNKHFNPWLPRSQRFCSRVCADAFHAEEKKEALHWYRAWLDAGRPGESEIEIERCVNAEQEQMR